MRILLLAALVGGCAHGPDPETACRLARQERDNIPRMSPGELTYYSRGTPAGAAAASAYSQQLAALSLGVIGAAALVSGFIENFAGDPATDPGVRDSAYGLVGGAIGVGAIALILGLASRPTLERARAQYRAFADRCGGGGEAPP